MERWVTVSWHTWRQVKHKPKWALLSQLSRPVPAISNCGNVKKQTHYNLTQFPILNKIYFLHNLNNSVLSSNTYAISLSKCWFVHTKKIHSIECIVYIHQKVSSIVSHRHKCKLMRFLEEKLQLKMLNIYLHVVSKFCEFQNRFILWIFFSFFYLLVQPSQCRFVMHSIIQLKCELRNVVSEMSSWMRCCHIVNKF